jgi:hypothetical protein
MEFALLNRLTDKPGQRDRAVRDPARVGKAVRRQLRMSLVSRRRVRGRPQRDLGGGPVASEEEHAEALKMPEMRPFVEQCVPLLEGMPEQIKVRPVGGKVPGGRTR